MSHPRGQNHSWPGGDLRVDCESGRLDVGSSSAKHASLAIQEDGRPLGDLLSHPDVWSTRSAQARNKIAHGSVRSLPGVSGSSRLGVVVS